MNAVEDLLTWSIANVQCLWRLNARVPTADSGISAREEVGLPYHTFDILFTTVSISPLPNSSEPLAEAEIHVSTLKRNDRASGLDSNSWMRPYTERSKALSFIQNAIMKNVNRNGSQTTALKLLLPAIDGYIVRTDLIQRRLLNCDLAESLSDFTSPRQHVRRFVASSEDVLQAAVSSALGAILLKGLPGVNRPLLESAMSLLESQVMARLSFPWILDIPIPRKRLAIVEGRPHPSVSAASEGVFRAAAALDIGLVILDQEGHWLQSATNEHLRDEFLVCDLHVDNGLASRIVETLSKSRGMIDGIVTYSDKHLVATAKAAQTLGLYTNPPEAVEACNDKRKMREMTTPDLPILLTTGIEDLRMQLRSLAFPLHFPLIVKPSQGTSSEGVIKVPREADLEATVEKLQEKFPGKKFLIEPYVTGPEVDANFVLLDGQILFNETNDDFPSSAETPCASPSPSFAEMSTIMPSDLPQSELSLLRSSLLGNLANLGCRNGVFHIEARVKDSRKRYQMTDQRLELMDWQSDAACHPDPSVFLIEINARTPGHQESFAVEFTYGIDYYALYMLLATLPSSLASRSDDTHTGDERDFESELARLHALSQPFPAHIQYPTHIVFIPVTRGGTFVSTKPLPQSLMDFIPHYRILMKKGQIVQNPEIEGRWPFVAYFLVTSKLVGKEGREQARALGETVRETFDYELV